MAKNYYPVLGISPDATTDDIKEAYRRMAKAFHPDHYGKNPAPFLEIQEAYAVLSDPEKRERHDLSLRNQRKKPSPGAERWGRRPVEPLIPGTDSAEIFFGRNPVSGADQPLRPDYHSPRRDCLVGPEQLIPRAPFSSPAERILTSGGRAGLLIRLSCPDCGGRGAVGPHICLRCRGSGRIFLGPTG